MITVHFSLRTTHSGTEVQTTNDRTRAFAIRDEINADPRRANVDVYLVETTSVKIDY